MIASGPAWEGWVEPPAYTGRPSIYLADVPEGLLVTPEGSRITIRIYGDDGSLTVRETVSAAGGTAGQGDPADAAGADAPAADAAPAGSDTDRQSITVARTGNLAIEGAEGASWTIRMIEDAPPSVAVAGPVESDAMGEMALPFEARDDYAVAAGQAEIALDLDAVTRDHGLPPTPIRASR